MGKGIGIENRKESEKPENKGVILLPPQYYYEVNTVNFSKITVSTSFTVKSTIWNFESTFLIFLTKIDEKLFFGNKIK